MTDGLYAVPANANVSVGVIFPQITSAQLPGGIQDTNTLDYWAIAAEYSFAGFSVYGTFTRQVDGLAAYSDTRFINVAAGTGITPTAAQISSTGSKGKGDRDTWLIGASYGQDNWNIAGYFGERDNQGAGVRHATSTTAGQAFYANETSEYLSLAGDVTIGKVKLYGVYDTVGNVGGVKGVDDLTGTLGVQYNFSAQTRAWIEYVSQDDEGSTTEQDWFQLGLKYYF